jgi:hypothetical protein
MNREDIIRAMRSACDKDKVNAWKNNFWTITQEELERFAYLVAAKEREACAKVCEDNADCCNLGSPIYTILSSNAAAIRARGNDA